MNSCCALLVGVSLAIGQAPVNEHLKVLEPLIGEWEGEVTMVEDVPGVGKTGDKIAVSLEYAWTPNGQALIDNVAVIQDGVPLPFLNSQIMWCPKERGLVGVSTSKLDQGVGRSKLTVDDDKLVFVGEGMSGDGTANSSKSVISGLGTDKLVLNVVDRVEDGETLPDFQVTYRRVDTTSTREEFEEFCKAWKGLWVTTTTLEADAPGVGKEGDEVTVYADCDVVNNGNTMICKGLGGDGANTWIVAYSANERQLKTMWTTSSGIFSRGTMYKKGETWIQRSKGCQPDGTSTSWRHVVTISDEGETHTWDGKGRIGDEPVVETHEVYHRIGK